MLFGICQVSAHISAGRYDKSSVEAHTSLTFGVIQIYVFFKSFVKSDTADSIGILSISCVGASGASHMAKGANA